MSFIFWLTGKKWKWDIRNCWINSCLCGNIYCDDMKHSGQPYNSLWLKQCSQNSPPPIIHEKQFQIFICKYYFGACLYGRPASKSQSFQKWNVGKTCLCSTGIKKVSIYHKTLHSMLVLRISVWLNSAVIFGPVYSRLIWSRIRYLSQNGSFFKQPVCTCIHHSLLTFYVNNRIINFETITLCTCSFETVQKVRINWF